MKSSTEKISWGDIVFPGIVVFIKSGYPWMGAFVKGVCGTSKAVSASCIYWRFDFFKFGENHAFLWESLKFNEASPYILTEMRCACMFLDASWHAHAYQHSQVGNIDLVHSRTPMDQRAGEEGMLQSPKQSYWPCPKDSSSACICLIFRMFKISFGKGLHCFKKKLKSTDELERKSRGQAL